MTEPKIEIKKLTDFMQDPQNANKGSQRGHRILDDSVRDLGAGRSMLADKDGVLIAGNKSQDGFVENGYDEVIVVHTDGTRPVVVQRDDLDLSEKAGKARKLAYVDNRSSQFVEWDASQIVADIELGVDLDNLFQDYELEKIIYDAVAKDMESERLIECPECGHEFLP